MANTESISISLPADVVTQAREAAKQHCGSLDTVVSIALQREMQRRENFKAMLREGHEWGRQMGITCEEDVERVANGEISLDQLRKSA
jgi:hypothetical protein